MLYSKRNNGKTYEPRKVKYTRRADCGSAIFLLSLNLPSQRYSGMNVGLVFTPTHANLTRGKNHIP